MIPIKDKWIKKGHNIFSSLEIYYIIPY